MKKLKSILLVTLLTASLTGPAVAETEDGIIKHDTVMIKKFPTEATIRFVLDCMSSAGGISEENMYACICRHDFIATNLDYFEYEEGRTYERNRRMPGEKGAFFRDSKRGEQMFEKMAAVREDAFSQCPVPKRVQRK